FWSEVTMMESRVTRKCHARFGERNEETHQPQGWKVRFVPTPFSPLLANIGLHGLEKYIKSINPKLGIIRYADDFIVTAKDSESLERVLILIKQWLSIRGLETNENKTGIVHINDGFNFLGFNLRQYNGKLLIKPQKEKVLAFCKRIGKSLSMMKTRTQDDPSLREYWYKRSLKMGKNHWAKGSKYEQIAKLQDWRCPVCGDNLLNGEEIETHHIVPVAEGGLNDRENLMHLHRACHKQVHNKPKSKAGSKA
ncbi:MAG: hypothetical protein F6K14_01460, partial [Symploca sp. SIO2C1]|nr:hypothetical protein [Symploca sp. SIO2C1]